jgi:photosystem II stability/assembly factor-like uncharacterized protein
LKKFQTVVLIMVLITIGFGINVAPNVEAKSSWKQILQCKVTHQATVVGYINDNCGITVGRSGECHYTLDGGKSWPQAQNNSMCRYGLDYVDEKTVWNCGNGSQVRRSDDGGQIWNEVSNCISERIIVFKYISFINDQTGWVASETQLVVTNNGGQNWIELESPSKMIGAISLLSDNEGYILDTDNMLYFTKDAGKTWGTQKMAIKDTLFSPAMRFLDTNRAIIIAFSVKQKKEIALTTANGGKTWRREIVCDRIGIPYIRRDGKLVTLLAPDQTITVLKQEEK